MPETPSKHWLESDVNDDGTVDPHSGVETFYGRCEAAGTVETDDGVYLCVIVDQPGTYTETRVLESTLNGLGWFRKPTP